MAILDTSISGSFVEDRDNDVFIGIDLPFYKSSGPEGYFASTKTTIEAVKNNVSNLIRTQKGERYLQPNLGINLRSYLFEQITPGLNDRISEDILSNFSRWLPFVKIADLKVNVDGNTEFERNRIKVEVLFSLEQAPTMLQSVQVEI